MVVEDHWVWSSAAVKHLTEASGIEVAGVATGFSEAIDLAVASQPDVALVDRLLGNESGIKIVWALRTSAPRTRGVIITTEPTPWAQDEARQAGAVGFVDKDRLVTHADLLRVVRMAAAGETCFDDEMNRGDGADQYKLTVQEQEIIRCLSAGMGTAEISRHLCVGAQTVRNKTHRIGIKLGVSGRLEIVAKALAEQLLDSSVRGSGAFVDDGE